MDWLKGKKTYFVLGAAAAIWFGETSALLPAGSLDAALPLLVMAGGATVADKLNRLAG